MPDRIRLTYRFQLQNLIAAAIRRREMPPPAAVEAWAQQVAMRALDAPLLVREVGACCADLRPELAARYGVTAAEVEAWQRATTAARQVEARWAALTAVADAMAAGRRPLDVYPITGDAMVAAVDRASHARGG